MPVPYLLTTPYFFLATSEKRNYQNLPYLPRYGLSTVNSLRVFVDSHSGAGRAIETCSVLEQACPPGIFDLSSIARSSAVVACERLDEVAAFADDAASLIGPRRARSGAAAPQLPESGRW